jgi:hypothetical protein
MWLEQRRARSIDETDRRQDINILLLEMCQQWAEDVHCDKRESDETWSRTVLLKKRQRLKSGFQPLGHQQWQTIAQWLINSSIDRLCLVLVFTNIIHLLWWQNCLSITCLSCVQNLLLSLIAEGWFHLVLEKVSFFNMGYPELPELLSQKEQCLHWGSICWWCGRIFPHLKNCLV